VKKTRQDLPAVLYNLAESIRIVSILIQPFMPETPEKIWHQLGINDKKYVEWETAKKWGVYPEGAAVNKGRTLVPEN